MKPSVSTRLRALALLLAIAAPAIHAEAPVDVRSATARALVEDMMDETRAPGVTVSVGLDGRIVFSEGFGYADVEQRVPVWPSITRFRIGSVSKPITAVAVAQLWEQGKLDLDAPIQRYVPAFPKKEKGEITTRHLAGHLAGIRHYEGEEFLSQKYFATVLEGLEIFQDDALLHEPGTSFLYSSYGWNLVSAVVEGASGEDFLSYMETHVFDPIGMDRTIADHVERIIANRTRYYVLDDGELKNAPPVDNSYKWAGGGFLSTSEDLVRFGFAHLGESLLRPETIEVLWTPLETKGGEATGYGLGWRVARDDGGRLRVGHGGGSMGGTTMFVMYPEERAVVAVISNMSGVDYGELPQKILDLFLADDTTSAARPGPPRP